jgi:hypothetical protein
VAQDKRKYSLPRRVMPGQKLPSTTERAVESRSLELIRQQEWTEHLHFFLTDTASGNGGSRGIRLNKLDREDGQSHALVFQVEGENRWALGMDYDTEEDGNSDWVLAYDNSANDEAGADVIRVSPESHSSNSATCKIAMGRVVGTPSEQDSFLLIDGGDNTTPLGGMLLQFYGSSTTNALNFVNRSSSVNTARFNWNNLWIMGTDLLGTNANDLWLAFDSTSSLHRIFVKQDSNPLPKIGIGSTNPQAALSVLLDINAAANTVQRVFHSQIANDPTNRAINIETIREAGVAIWNYIWLEAGLGAGSTVGTRVATSGGARAWGWEGGDNQMAMVSAPAGTNQTITRPFNVDFSGGVHRVGFFNVTPQARTGAYTQTYSTADRTMANLTAAALTHAFGTADGTVDDVTGAFDQTILNNNFKELTTQIAALLADVTDVKQGLNSVIDDLQGYGLLQ